MARTLGAASPFLAPTQHPGQYVPLDVVYFDDFVLGGYCPDAGLSSESDPYAKFSEVADRGEWFLTTSGGDPTAAKVAIQDDEPGGVVVFRCDGDDNDYVHGEINGESFKLAADKPLYYEVRMKSADVSDCNWLLGLSIAGETNPLGAGPTDFVAFWNNDTSDDIEYSVGKNNTSGAIGAGNAETTADTGYDLTDDTFRRLAFEWDGVDSIRFYVDGNLIATVASNIPDDEAMTPVFQIRNEGGNAEESIEIDYIRVIQKR